MAQFTIRIPDELHDRIRRAATADKRSVNGEIEWLLDSALSPVELAALENPEIRAAIAAAKAGDPAELRTRQRRRGIERYDRKESGDAETR